RRPQSCGPHRRQTRLARRRSTGGWPPCGKSGLVREGRARREERSSSRMADLMLITRADIEQAHARIASHIRRTPILSLPTGAFGYDGPLSLKLEFLQHSGSFKARGAFNAILSGKIGPAGVAAASGGNHGAAVAFAARQLGVKARIFVPRIASPAKVAVIHGYGADVVVEGERYADAQEACDLYVAETG